MRLYCLFIAVSSSDVPSLSLRNSEVLLFFLLLHPYAQHCIPSLPISFSFSNLYLVCFRELSTSAENVPKKKRKFLLVCFLYSDLNFNWGPKVPIPNFPGQIFTKSYFPSDCLVQILFVLFFADESQSHCIESNFPYQKISTFQFPFYLFRILSKWNKKWMRNRNCLLSCQLKHVMFTLSLPYISYIESNNGPPQEQYST